MTRPDLIGIDLAGPTNRVDTAVASLRTSEAGPVCVALTSGHDDEDLAARIESWHDAPCVGLDAPLSYQPGGGDRGAEKELRAAVRGRLPASTVMTPTMTRMAYLTLRGLAVARLILALRPAARIVEVHPAAHMVLCGAPADDVRSMKTDASARARLLDWWRQREIADLPAGPVDDHTLAAIAAASAAAQWARGEPHLRVAARPPLHPFDVSA